MVDGPIDWIDMQTPALNIPKRSDICVTIRLLAENRPDVFSNLTLHSLPRALDISGSDNSSQCRKIDVIKQ